ncbi:MAG: hypothetical protein ACMG6E_06680 [Candidatus Roizmanbacteria bacterium]
MEGQLDPWGFGDLPVEGREDLLRGMEEQHDARGGDVHLVRWEALPRGVLE